MSKTENSSNQLKSKENSLIPRGGEESLPRTFGRLTLLRRVARGGMGEVYLASTRGIEGAERACVVKKIRREHQADKSFRARFLDEARIQSQLQHPGVAQILEAATDEEECPYAVVEYIEGRHLGEILSRSNQLGVPLNWADAVAIGISFADALAHVHERKDPAGRPLEIAHRDLSPQNVMVGYGGDVKLIDFGTARGENRRCRTVSGIVYAKPGYVAPEVANQIPGAAPADIYALGVMLWEIVSGRRFLQGDAVEHQAQVAHGNRPLPPMAENVGAPCRLDEILAKATATEITDRYGSCQSLVSDLVMLLKSAPSLADGDRSVRGRIAQLMQSLYPAEPARSRADFARRVAHAREVLGGEKSNSRRPGIPEPSPLPPELDGENDKLLSGTRYRLNRCISRGGMGEVWEATHVDLGRKVALKLMPEGAAQSGGARRKFRSEARALARLHHPGLVEVHDFGVTAHGRCYYGMEFLEGETLEARLTRGPLPWREAIRLISDAAEALGAVHEAGIVHRDITPANLFISKEGEVKLLDFGVSKSQERGDEETADAPTVVGTPEYISPEQAAGGQADVRSDIYGLGVVLFEMLTGSVPHPLGDGGSPTLPALLTAKITLIPPAPSARIQQGRIPKELDRVVAHMLKRDAEKRLASSAQVVAKLRTIGQRKLEVPSTSQLSILSAAAAFLLIVSGGLWIQGGSQAQEEEEVRRFDVDVLARQVESDEAKSQVETAKNSGDTAMSQQAKPLVATKKGSSSAPVEDPLRKQVEAILALKKRGARIKAHHQMKRLALHSPNNIAVARGLVSTARGVKAWGEAYRAAQFWSKQAGTPEAGVALARLQRATLRGNPIKTLEEVLRTNPDFSEAEKLLAKYRGKKLATR